MNGPRPRQLLLGLDLPASLDADDFIVGAPNAAAFALVESWPDWPGRVMAVAGPAGCGKSHLAGAWAAKAGARIVPAASLSGADLPALLSSGALAVDDLAAGLGGEAALFHLFNLVREDGAYLLLAGRASPANLPVALPDLASRLRAVPTVGIGPPDDALLAQVMVKLLADRQIEVEPNVPAYLVRRMERSLSHAHRVVETLDRLALEEGRRITRALAARALGENT